MKKNITFQATRGTMTALDNLSGKSTSDKIKKAIERYATLESSSARVLSETQIMEVADAFVSRGLSIWGVYAIETMSAWTPKHIAAKLRGCTLLQLCAIASEAEHYLLEKRNAL